MELVLLEETEPINFIINDDCIFLKLPRELIDRIIFSCPPEKIGVLKNSCRYLASLASLLRIDEQHIRNFTIPDEEARLDLFKNIVKTDNPAYIKKILEYGKKEAHFHHQKLENSTVITLDTSVVEKDYLDQNYLPFLLEYAIEKNKYNSVYTLISNGADPINRCNTTTTPLEYAAQHDSECAIQALLDYNTFNADQIDEALDAAWFRKKQKALDLLSTKTENHRYNQYLTAQKEEQCARIKRLIYTGTMIILVITGGTIGITFQTLTYLRTQNITI